MKVIAFMREWGGFVFSLCGFLWWLGITPDKVGQAVYGVSYWVVPPVLLFCGVWMGWSLKRLQMTRANITQGHIKELADRAAELQAKLEDREEIDKEEGRCQSILNDLVELGERERMATYLKEIVNNAPIVDASRNAKAIELLRIYRCVSGFSIKQRPTDGHPEVFTGLLKLQRTSLPSLDERRKLETIELANQEAAKEFERKSLAKEEQEYLSSRGLAT